MLGLALRWGLLDDGVVSSRKDKGNLKGLSRSVKYAERML